MSKKGIKAQQAARKVKEVAKRSEGNGKPKTAKHAGYARAGWGWLSWFRKKD